MTEFEKLQALSTEQKKIRQQFEDISVLLSALAVQTKAMGCDTTAKYTTMARDGSLKLLEDVFLGESRRIIKDQSDKVSFTDIMNTAKKDLGPRI